MYAKFSLSVRWRFIITKVIKLRLLWKTRKFLALPKIETLIRRIRTLDLLILFEDLNLH